MIKSDTTLKEEEQDKCQKQAGNLLPPFPILTILWLKIYQFFTMQLLRGLGSKQSKYQILKLLITI